MSVGPWESFANPRAYTAAPMAPGVAVFHAAAWIFSHSEDLSWASLGIVVPDRSLVPELEQLRRLKSRGVRMGTIAQAVFTHSRMCSEFSPMATTTLAWAMASALARVAGSGR